MSQPRGISAGGQRRAATNAAEFESILPNIEKVKEFFTDFDVFSEPERFAVSRFMANEAEPNTLFLNNDLMKRIGVGEKRNIDSSTIVSTTNKKSRHGLFFRDLNIGRTTLRLAIKPYKDGDGWTPAVTEQILTKAYQNLGFHTLNPQGLLLCEDKSGIQSAYGLTEVYRGLTTFDSMDWRGFYDARTHNPGMVGLWKAVAEEVAAVHHTGRMSHLDLEARNIATSPRRDAFAIDMESFRFGEGESRDAEVRFSFSQPDLVSVMKSICLPRIVPGSNVQGLGMIENNVSTDWSKVYRDVFLDDYLAERYVLLEQEKSGQNRADIAEELGQLSVDLKMYAKTFQARFLDAMGRDG